MIAILSDIHGNLSALEAVVQDALARGCTRFISLGDVAGYYAQPGECINILREHDAINIMGNHDGYLVSDTNCPRSRVVAAIIEYQKTITDESQKTWLRQSLPLLRESDRLYVHGGPSDPRDQYLYNVSERTLPADVGYLFAGHTHVQALVHFANGTFCNPGSVGQPRDGDSRAAYAVITENTISMHRVAYDIDRTVAAMRSAGFDAFYYENLYIGAQLGGRIDKITTT
ncbi:MAG: metallophosphoesterase family protein [Dokdonella sp.]